MNKECQDGTEAALPSDLTFDLQNGSGFNHSSAAAAHKREVIMQYWIQFFGLDWEIPW